MSEFIPENLIDVPSPEIRLSPDGHPGYTPALKAADTLDAMKDACKGAARDFPSELWIEPKDWQEWSDRNDENNTWPINYVDRFTNQSPTHQCTVEALRALAEGCRNRQRGIIFKDGPKHDSRYEESKKGSIWLSVLSVYAEANPAQWGGAGCQQVLEIACRRGFLPEKFQPAEYKFKHRLQGTAGTGNMNQSKGPWVRLGDFPDGWEETAKLFRPLEVIFTETWEQVVCLVLRGSLIEVGRSGHAIPYAKWNVAQKVMTYVDSYNVLRFDSLSTVKGCSRGAFAIRSMTVPDDWLNPAGVVAA